MAPGVRATLPVLVAAAGAPWETRALELVGRSGSGLAVQRRCVDLHDLVATARTGLAQAALVSADLPGLDADTVETLRRCGVGIVVVVPDSAPSERLRMQRIGARAVVDPALEGLRDLLTDAVAGDTPDPGDQHVGAASGPTDEGAGRVLAVWGPAGAPGRTTVATAVAAELARRGEPPFLVDADPYGGAVAQHLGVLDEVSGLLAAARSANAGRLDTGTLAAIARTVGPEGLRLLTGLPRPDRWSEVRAPAFDDILTAASMLAPHVVVDVGFSLESDAADPFGAAPQRNGMTLAALERADRVLVVGSADPVGLARLARGLVELHELFPTAALHVVVNRARTSLGWSDGEVRGMVEGFVGPVPVSFLPDDRTTADRALMAGRSIVESGDSPLHRAVVALVDALVPGVAAPDRVRRRRAGRGR